MEVMVAVVSRESILEAFERHRAAPGTPYDESHFLDFLMRSPKSKGAVHNSFSGLRRYNSFLDEVQLQYGVCFSIADFETSYSLDRFVERVSELQGSRRGSMASFRNQQRHGYGMGAIFWLNIIAIALVSFTAYFSHILAGVLALALLLSDAAVVHSYFRWRSYNAKLSKLLGSNARDT